MNELLEELWKLCRREWLIDKKNQIVKPLQKLFFFFKKKEGGNKYIVVNQSFNKLKLTLFFSLL